MGFITGSIFGAVLGVVAERLWFRYERIPKLDIFGGESMGVGGEGYHFTIINRGIFEILSISLFTKKSFSMFGVKLIKKENN